MEVSELKDTTHFFRDFGEIDGPPLPVKNDSSLIEKLAIITRFLRSHKFPALVYQKMILKF